jgi:hypothetical protein
MSRVIIKDTLSLVMDIHHKDQSLSLDRAKNSASIKALEAEVKVSDAKAKVLEDEMQLKEDISVYEIDKLKSEIGAIDQQTLESRIKNGDIAISYTYNDDGSVKSKEILADGTSVSMWEQEIELSKQKIATIIRELELKETLNHTQVKQLNAQIDVSEQQTLGEQIKNGDLALEYTYDDNGEIVSKSIVADGTSMSIYESEVSLNKAKAEQFGLYGVKESMSSVDRVLGMSLNANIIPPAGMLKFHKDLCALTSGYEPKTFDSKLSGATEYTAAGFSEN